MLLPKNDLEQVEQGQALLPVPKAVPLARTGWTGWTTGKQTTHQKLFDAHVVVTKSEFEFC